MANHTEANVYYVDTNDTTIPWKRIDAVKYIGNTSGTAIIKSENSSGDNLWQEAGANILPIEEVRLRDAKGFNIQLTNGAAVYLYSYM